MGLLSPSLIKSWDVQPGSNPTVVIGRTEIDFRLYPRTPSIYTGYYIFDTKTKTEILRDDGKQNFIADERYASIVLDVDGDGEQEIITVTPENNLRCLKRDGTQVWNRGFTEAYTQLGCPALFDLDNDGQYEVVFGRYLYPNTANDQLVVVHAKNGTIKRTVALGPIRPFTAPVIGDVDNDGDPEIVLSGEINKKLYSIGAGGNIEWQVTLPGNPSKQSPIMGDFDADGEVEVVMVDDDGRVFFVSGYDGSLKRTVSTGDKVEASPVAADVNDDGYLEVIVTQIGTAVVAVDRNGRLTTWKTTSPSPQSKRFSTPAIADVDNDNIPEIITVDSVLRIFKWSGQWEYTSPQAGWSNEGNSPVVFDSDDNGFLDIVYFMTGPAPAAGSPPSSLYRIDTTTPSSKKTWLTLKNDFRRSGVYGSDLYGVDPDLTISNRNWSYGTISKGSIAYKDFYIENVGKAILSGSCLGQAKITVNDTSAFSIAPGTSKGFRAYFDTSAQGIQTGFLIITTNDPDEPKLNLTCTANITQPQHDIAAYAIHVAGQLNPNYVNDPPIKVEFRNLGSFREKNITANLTINGTLCANLTPATFDLNPADRINVTFYWDQSNPTIAGEGTFLLRAAAQNANISDEADKLNNIATKTVEVKYPLKVLSATTWRALNLTSYTATNNFTEGDIIIVEAVIQNQWSVPVTFIAVVNVQDVTGAPVPAYSGAYPELTIAGGAQVTIRIGWYLGLDIGGLTKYNATVYAYDKLGGGVRILAFPYVHTFWVHPS